MGKSTNVLKSLMVDYEIRKILSDNGDDQSAIECIDNEIIKHKREYRKLLKKEYEASRRFYDTNGEIVAHGGDFDMCWFKIFFPGEKWTDEEKNEFVEIFWKPYIPSIYDCTGQIFTTSISCFNVPRGVVVYIKEAMDI